MNSLLPVLRSLLVITLLVYLAMLLFAWLYADRVMFQPRPSSYSPSPEIVTLPGGIAAAYLHNPAARYTVLYSHGNGEDLGDILPWLRVMRERGFSVISYDYPGYGLSSGKPTEAGAVAAAQAAWDYLLREKKVPRERIILHGYSVGSGPSVALAAEGKGAGLVLESAFTSAFRTVTRITLLPLDRFRNLGTVAKLHLPLLVIHGRKDRIIPFSHGQALHAAAPGPKLNLWVDKGGHWDLRDEAGESYWEAWRGFTALLEKRKR